MNQRRDEADMSDPASTSMATAPTVGGALRKGPSMKYDKPPQASSDRKASSNIFPRLMGTSSIAASVFLAWGVSLHFRSSADASDTPHKIMAAAEAISWMLVFIIGLLVQIGWQLGAQSSHADRAGKEESRGNSGTNQRPCSPRSSPGFTAGFERAAQIAAAGKGTR